MSPLSSWLYDWAANESVYHKCLFHFFHTWPASRLHISRMKALNFPFFLSHNPLSLFQAVGQWDSRVCKSLSITPLKPFFVHYRCKSQSHQYKKISRIVGQKTCCYQSCLRIRKYQILMLTFRLRIWSTRHRDNPSGNFDQGTSNKQVSHIHQDRCKPCWTRILQMRYYDAYQSVNSPDSSSWQQMLLFSLHILLNLLSKYRRMEYHKTKHPDTQFYQHSPFSLEC